MAERRHTGSRRLSACSASLLLACAGALGAHAAELARPSDADLRAALPAATAGAASQAAHLAVATAAAPIDPIDPIALINPIALIAGDLDQAGVCQRLAEAATAEGELAAMTGAALRPDSAAPAAAAGSSNAGPAAAAAAAPAVTPATVASPAHPAAATPPPAPKPHPALGFDATFGVPRRPFGKLIYQIARTYALNPLLVAAIAKVESDFNPRARSRKGAYGLMQVLPSTARRFGLPRKRDLFNPRKNLETASRYLRWLVDRFGDDPVRVLAAYNAGEGAVDRFGGVPPFSETRDYVQRIFGLLGFSVLLDAPATAPVAAAAAALAGVAGAR
ncbi:MAG TPA: lytic transglycosylase domain-containing protein [Thermoanaerobaculia bacterium]|nr:lytic transglycosylase domain-containing protein [Thermoanaerobaculia bacterium]